MKNVTFYTFDIEPENNQRLDQLISSHLPEYSRSTIKNWINADKILVNGKACTPKDKISSKSEIEIEVECEFEEEVEEEEIEDVRSVQEATKILRNLHGQVENSVNMLENYLERAEAMTKDVHTRRSNEFDSDERLRKLIGEMEMRHAIDNRRLAGRYHVLEKRLKDIESAVMEEQKSSLESLRVLLRTIRKKK